MQKCNNCGAPLLVGNTFCNKCGSKVVSNISKESQISVDEKASKEPEQRVSEHLNPVITLSPDLRSLSKEASITLADKLLKDYKEYEKVKKEVADLESWVSRPDAASNTNNFNYLLYWRPFAIAAAIVFNVIILGPSLLATTRIQVNIDMASRARLAVILVVGIGVAGLIHTMHKKKTIEALYNEALENGKKKKKEEKKRLELLKNNLIGIENNLSEYNELIPSLLRESSYMSRAKIMIQTGKADNLYDALEMILNSN